MTIQEIITEITAEIGGDSTDTTLAANLLSFCKAALRRIPNRVRDRALIAISTTTLSSGSQTATLPTTFLKERGKGSVWRVESGCRKIIEKSHYERFNADNYSSNASGPPNLYRIYGSLIEFDCKADQAYTIYIEHFKALTTAGVALGDTFALREDAVEAFKDLVKMYYYEYEEDETKAEGRYARALQVFREIDDEFVDAELGDHIEATE